MPHIAALGATPSLLPISADGEGVRLISLGEADYRALSFLDARLLDAGTPLTHCTWSAVEEAASGLSPQASFIFHIGHVGSTLLSRLLGEHPQLFSVREPALLREIALGGLRDRLAPLAKLFARTWHPDQTALIKATSFVSEIAPQLMAQAEPGRAILLATTPPVYLRTILAAEGSRQEAQALAALRQDRLARRLGRQIICESEGERIAAAWLCEVASLHALAVALPHRCLWLDFDRVLAEPAAALRLIFTYLGVESARVDPEQLVSGPLMRRYSKAPEHAYDADLRRQVLDQAARTSAGAVREAMDWLQRMAGLHPRVGLILQQAAKAARASLAATPRAG